MLKNRLQRFATLLAFIGASSLASSSLAAAIQQPAENLVQTFERALGQDPTWASARSANVASQEILEQGKALYLPTVTLDSEYNRSRTNVEFPNNPARQIFQPGRQQFDTFSYGLTINQPIFRKDFWEQFQQSKLQVSQADLQLALARQNLILRVSQAYFDVLLAQDNLDLIKAQKAAISQQLEQARANFDVGTATITDVNEAQARFDLTDAQEIAAINQIELRKRALQAITGETPEALASVRTDLQPKLPDNGDMQYWVQLAEQNSLALAIDQYNQQIASRALEIAQAGHLPRLGAVARYSDSRAEGGVQGFGRELEDLTVGLRLEIPIYEGGAISSRAREAAANLDRAKQDLETTRRQVELDTRQAYLDVNTGVAQIKAFEQALQSSQSQLESTQLGYEVGVRTSVDVLNAQQQLFTAKRDLLQARYNYLLGLIRLKFAAGLLSDQDLAEINQQLVAGR